MQFLPWNIPHQQYEKLLSLHFIFLVAKLVIISIFWEIGIEYSLLSSFVNCLCTLETTQPMFLNLKTMNVQLASARLQLAFKTIIVKCPSKKTPLHLVLQVQLFSFLHLFFNLLTNLAPIIKFLLVLLTLLWNPKP